MLKLFVQFYKEHTFKEFGDMIAYMIDCHRYDYIKDKYSLFINHTKYFLLEWTDQNLDRMEEWLKNHYKEGEAQNGN